MAPHMMLFILALYMLSVLCNATPTPQLTHQSPFLPPTSNTDMVLSLNNTPAYERKWWKEANVYQIYPASFNDHAANSHGTLRGIIERVPYLYDLGVDIIWVSPIFQSPQADMGYDISDYQKIDPRYGNLSDWDDLRDACHERGMKLVMDLVVNHSSDQHAWFKASRLSKTDSKRDWYYWHPGVVDDKGERKPPNNWRSRFGTGPTWTWDEDTQEYYMHSFLKEQPDLNWTNKELRQAVYDMMRWWLDRGCDGFRCDVINFIAKAPGWPDAPITDPSQPYQNPGNLNMNRPEVHPYLQELHESVLLDYDCFMVGECPGKEGPESFVEYSKPENKELQMVFNFHGQWFDRLAAERSWRPDWKLTDLKKVYNKWHVELPALGGWMSNFLENHDQPRMVTRIGSEVDDESRAKSAKLISMFHTTLSGTIFVFQGQEIGQVNVPRYWTEEDYVDIEAVQRFEGEREWCERNNITGREREERLANVLVQLRETGRDNGRTVMQWDSSENAGFSKAKPWMRVHDDYKQWNVAKQRDDPNSIWSFWQAMLRLRKTHLSMVYGTFIPLDEDSEDNYSYIRRDPVTGETILVLLNMARGNAEEGVRIGKSIVVDPAAWGVDVSTASLLISNDGTKVGSGITGPITLDRWGGRVYLLHPADGLPN